MQQLTCECGQTVSSAATCTNCPACGRPLIAISLEPIRFGTRSRPDVPAADCLVLRPVLVEQSTAARDDVYRVVPPDARNTEEEEDRRRLAEILRQTSRHEPDPPWPLEQHWWECLKYPVRTAGFLAGLAFATSIVFLPALPLWAILFSDLAGLPPFALWTCVAAVVWMAACAFLQNVLVTALQGDTHSITHPYNPLDAMLAAWRCFVSFLPGPALLVFVAIWYWRHAGELAMIDQALLIELLLVAVCYWFFSFFAMVKDNSYLPAAPLRIVALVRTLGKPAATVPALALVFVLVQLPLLRGAVVLFHEESFLSSWWSMLLWTFATLAGLTFLLRWLGVCCFRCLGATPKATHAAGVGRRVLVS